MSTALEVEHTEPHLRRTQFLTILPIIFTISGIHFQHPVYKNEIAFNLLRFLHQMQVSRVRHSHIGNSHQSEYPP